MATAKQVYKFSQTLKVLYVEDDAKLQSTTKVLFESFFKLVDIAADGIEGLKKYNDNEYDIIITDINMPNMDGTEMIAKINEINPEQKIIALSSYNESDILIELMQKGISSFILKPINKENILNILYPVCRDAYEQRENIELYKTLNEERELLKEKIKQLELQNNATDVKHQQLGQLIKEKNDGYSETLINEYFEKDEDEGCENVVFIKEDCDELNELFDEMPELMVQYSTSNNMQNIHKVIDDLTKVSSILLRYTPFLDTLSKSFNDLAVTIEDNIDYFASLFKTSADDLFMLWDAVSIDMDLYLKRFSVESMAMKNIHHIHTPTSLSIQQIITIISPQDLNSGEIDFF